ncbi:MAG: VWA domain-containing protein, partial [Actinobacteria bacterium]
PSFVRDWADVEAELGTTLKHARLRLPTVTMAEEILYAIADLSLRAGVDGHRADSVMARAATALAALEGKNEAGLAEVERVAPLVLAHRLRRRPFEEVPADAESMRSALIRALTGERDQEAGTGSSSTNAGPGQGQASIFESLGTSEETGQQGVFGGAELENPLDQTRRSIAGRRQESVSSDGRGRYSRSEPATGKVALSDVAIDATIRAAATSGSPSGSTCDLAVEVGPDDVRSKVRMRKVGASIVFCVDASGSMGASKRISAVKAAVLDLLVDAYQRRDRVALVSFRGDRADVVLAPTASVELANLKLKNLPSGGATPLAHGILRSLDLLESERRRQPGTVPWLVLLTDGRANVGLAGGLGSDDAKAAAVRLAAAKVHTIVIDTSAGGESSPARELARMSGGEYVRLASVDERTLAKAVRERL